MLSACMVNIHIGPGKFLPFHGSKALGFLTLSLPMLQMLIRTRAHFIPTLFSLLLDFSQVFCHSSRSGEWVWGRQHPLHEPCVLCAF